jgi:hypothetical protein
MRNFQKCTKLYEELPKMHKIPEELPIRHKISRGSSENAQNPIIDFK